VLRRKKRPTRGSAADVGVRPTICADVRKWENYAALAKIACPTTRYVPVTTPPSTLRTAPLMNDAASEASQT
jgi:hypothetical protein